MNITATVTARAANSTVPDRADAVDFAVDIDGRRVDVTLMVDGYSGKLDVWGSPDQWCSDPKAVEGIASQVTAACRVADEAGAFGLPLAASLTF
jgi:hypothetical protein